MSDLKQDVVSALKGRRMSEWEAIAKEAKVSFSMIAQLGRGHYKSSPSYIRLHCIAETLKKFPKQARAA